MVEQARHLPHDLIFQHILPKLPIKPLLQCKSVSKQWYSTLSSPHFAHTHFKLSPFSHTQFLFIQKNDNYYLFYCNDNDEKVDEFAENWHKNLVKLRGNFVDDDLVLIGSCNGLICLASFTGYFFILWNPITGKFQKYSDPELLVYSFRNLRVSWGFGYISLIDDFKVVRVLELGDALEVWVHVFSLKSNKWTRISNELYQDVLSLTTNKVRDFRYSYLFHSRQGVLVNQTLYWIVSKVNDGGRKVVAFDLALEMFHTVVELDLVSNDVYRDKFICALGGCLSKCGINMRDDVYVKVLKGDGKVESIRLSRSLGLRSCQSFVGFSRSCKFYILQEDSTIGIISPSSQPMKYTPLVTFEGFGKSRVASYVPSLILPYNYS